MSIPIIINNLTTARNTIRSKMVTAGQAESTDNLSVLAENLNISSSGTDTSDATATADDILKDKTAYVGSGKITGTLAIATEKELAEAIDKARS